MSFTSSKKKKKKKKVKQLKKKQTKNKKQRKKEKEKRERRQKIIGILVCNDLIFWCLTPLSAILQLYHADQF